MSGPVRRLFAYFPALLAIGFSAPVGAQSAPEPQALLEAALCDGRAGCALGRRLVSLSVASGLRHELWRITLPEEARSETPGCTLEEFWLSARDAAGTVIQKRLAGGGCAASSHPDAWCGAPPRVQVSVRGKSVHTSWQAPVLYCMGAYHSSGHSEFSLETLAPVREDWRMFRILPPFEATQNTLDYVTLRATRALVVEADACPALGTRSLPVIPSFETPEAVASEGWRSLDLHHCATRLGATHSFPQSSQAADLDVVVLRDGALVVEVRPRSPGRSAPPSARIEVCYAEFPAMSYAYCHSSNDISCAEFALDGRVLSGDLPIEVAPDRPRFKLTLPPDQQGLSVRYLEGPARKKPTLEHLGEVRAIDAALTSCSLTGDP